MKSLAFIEGDEFKPNSTLVFDSFDRQGDIQIEYKSAPVFFALSKRSEAIEIVHVAASGRSGKKGLRLAVNALIVYVSSCYPWCEMLLAPISLKSLYNTAKKTGFIDCGLIGNDAGTIHLMAVNYG